MAENEALFFIRFSSCCEARVTTEEGEEGEEEASATHTTHRVRDMEITTAVRTVADVHLVDILTRNWRDVEDELMGCEIGGRKKKKASTLCMSPTTRCLVRFMCSLVRFMCSMSVSGMYLIS